MLLLIAINSKGQAGKKYFLEAMQKEDIGEYKAAMEAYTKCIEVEPIAEAYFNRGHVKYELKNYIGAIEDILTAIKLKPSVSAPGYSDIGLYKYALNEYQSSIEYCTKSIELNPKQAEAYTNRAFSKRMLKLPF